MCQFAGARARGDETAPASACRGLAECHSHTIPHSPTERVTHPPAPTWPLQDLGGNWLLAALVLTLSERDCQCGPAACPPSLQPAVVTADRCTGPPFPTLEWDAASLPTHTPNTIRWPCRQATRQAR